MSELRIRRWASLDTIQIASSEGRLLGTPTASPDGEQVAFQRDGDLLVVDLRTGIIRTAARDVGCCLRWADNGYIYYSAGSTQNIMRVSAEGGTPEPITSPEDMAGREGEFHLMDDGDTGLFTVWANPPRLEAIRISTGERREVVPGLKSFDIGDGRIVYATMDGSLHAAEFDTRSMSLRGDPIQVGTDVLINLENYPVYSVTPNGTLAYVTQQQAGNMSPVWVTRDGSRSLIDIPSYDPAGNGPVAVSRDGRQIALSIIREARTDIWVKDLSRAQSPLRRLTLDGLTNDRPSWTPDGNSVVYLARSPGARAIYSLRADGSEGRELILENSEYRLLGGEISADGRWLIYRQGQDRQDLDDASGASDVLAYDLQAGGEPLPVADSEFNERAPAMSPDGRWVAYVSDQSGRDEIYVRPFPDSGPLVLVSLEGGGEPTWSADGRELFFRDGTQRMIAAAVSVDDGFRITEQQVLFPADEYQSSLLTRTYQVLPDGRFLMMLRADFGESIVLVQNWGQFVDERLSN